MKFLLFDLLFLLFGSLSYGTAFAAALLMAQRLWTDSLPLNCFIIFFAFIVFIYTFILSLGTLKFIFQPKLIVGDFPIGMNKDYFAWALNSIFCGLYMTSPMAHVGHILFSANWLFYRLMGMNVQFNSLIGLNTTIRQPELITVGAGSILGLGSIMSCHFTSDGKVHTQKPIKIGTKSVIGGYSALAPGVTIGDNSVIGAESRVFPDVVIGNNVRIGAFCYIDHAVTIPDNVKIKSYTRIRKEDKINSGEIWEGNPAQKIGDYS